MLIKPYLIDTTLRDGEQAPGVVFHIDEKLRIASLLEKTGISELEIGTPAAGEQAIKDMKSITSAGFKFKTLAWCRAIKSDMDSAIETGTNGINISFPVSDIHLLALGRDRRWVLKTLPQMTKYALSNFEHVAIGLQDASRTDIGFLLEVIALCFTAGASRVRIADTVGKMNPLEVRSLFIKLRRKFPKGNFEFHGHNDLGMATANTMTALLSGANAASLTVNGIGERAGNAALEEVLMAISHNTGIHSSYDTTHLSELSGFVSQSSGIMLPVNKAVTGSRSLSHESGIHTKLLLKNRSTYQIIEASSIGKQESKFIFGKHTGKAALSAFLDENNIQLSDPLFKYLLNKIRSLAQTSKSEIRESQLLEISLKLSMNTKYLRKKLNPSRVL